MEEKKTKRGGGRPKGTPTYHNDQGKVVAKIIHGMEKGEYANPNQGIVQHYSEIAGNSAEAQQKRLRRAITQPEGHLKMKMDFRFKHTPLDNGKVLIEYEIIRRFQDLSFGSAVEKNKNNSPSN